MLRVSYTDAAGIIPDNVRTQYMERQRRVLDQVRGGMAEYADSLGWLDPDTWGGSTVQAELTELAAEVRGGADVFVLTGVGGSNNAARAVITALAPDSVPAVCYAGNTLCAYELERLQKTLGSASFYVNVIAKNFETLEPGSAFRVLRSLLYKAYGSGAAARIICTGTPESQLHRLCLEHGWRFLPFPPDIGGRYSAVSPVGLFPMAAAGIDIAQLVQGARGMRRRLFSLDAQENPAYQYACTRNLLYQAGYAIELLSFFEPRLCNFSRWWIQLFAESEGKQGRGVFPSSAQYSEDLHSVGQFVQDGSRLIYETFVEVRNGGASCRIPADGVDDRFNYLDGRDFADINACAFDAVYQAHARILPCFKFSVDTLDAYTFGELFYFCEFACVLSSLLLGVNPFDQPGVEAYKQYLFSALGK